MVPFGFVCKRCSLEYDHMGAENFLISNKPVWQLKRVVPGNEEFRLLKSSINASERKGREK